MKQHHKIALGGFGTVVVIFMVVSGILLNGIIVKQQINHNELKEEIASLRQQTNDKINELAINLINTKYALNQNLSKINQDLSSVSEQVGVLKAETNSDFSEIIEKIIYSVVTIRTFSAQGTGFIISDQGYLVTNAHVIATEQGELSQIIQVIKTNGEEYTAEFIGAISQLDLALLKIEGDQKPIELADSSKVQIGEKVIAIGNPQGYQFSVTDGIVSAINRDGLNNMGAYIQTNAELNPGNSGGPLINTQGQVIGMNNFKLVNSEGLGFALESNKIKEGVNQISQEKLNQTLIN
jgi:S1-C subfamily serine protease